ncbi:MAG: WD40/YVTN/BNR-like repeat-containing protein [Thermoleophilaceae bacterium]
MRTAAATIALLVLAAAAHAGVTSPQSGWYAGNPLLGPNNMRELACAGSACYAAGAFGTVLKSADAGETWSGAITGLTRDLSRVRFVGGAADQIVVGGGCTLERSYDGASSFRRLPFTPSDERCASQLASVAFPTSDAGFVLLADGSVYATTDGGTTFSRRTAIGGAAARDLTCPSADTCFAVSADGSIERTDDGAGSWAPAGKADQALTVIRFADAKTGWAAGSASTVMKSDDGGATWTQKAVTGTPPADLTDVRCAPENPQLCLFATSAGDQLLRTPDGGQTFSSIAASPDPTYAVEFASATHALAAGAGGSVELSDDAGASWRPVGARVDGEFTVLRGVSATVALAGGHAGLVARTGDSGQSWQAISAPTTAPIMDVASSDGETIFALDALGGLARSSDAGATWQMLSTGGRRPNAVVAFSPQRLLLVGTRELALSTDGGDGFKAVAIRLVNGDSLQYADRAAGATVVYGPRALLESTDDGASWRHLPLPRIGRSETLRHADFVTPRTGWVMTTTRRLFRTRDGGGHWTELPGTGGAGVDMAFSDATHGYLAAPGFAYRYNGVVLRTSDGGASWRPQIVAPTFLQAVASGGSTDYALAGARTLYATRTGGDAGAPSRLTFKPSAPVVGRRRKVTLRGRLLPARPRAPVVVSARSRGRWIARLVTTSPNGSWASTWALRHTTGFVAQALGDATHTGAGTRYVQVAVR